jgi:hypothetical protein
VYYRKEVRYPATLTELREYEALPRELVPIAQDRFGKPWKYKLAGFKSVPKLFDQKYELQSGKLGIDSDLEESLAWPYGERIHITPVRMKSATAVEVVRGSNIEGAKILLGAERRVDDVLLAYVGRYILVFCNQDHWMVVRKPGAAQ